ncbi:transposase IS4 family protein [Bacillus freudenreichii]|nr:transposase IS4 family protein [Bacillus freudenreichii]
MEVLQSFRSSVETYRIRYCICPEAVLADQIYRIQEKRQYCKELGIRFSGPKLGRPSKDPQENRAKKQIEYQDALDWNTMEGKFGEGKRAYGLGLIQPRLQQTSESVIALQFLVMYLEKILQDTFLTFFHLFIRPLVSFYKLRTAIF